MKQPSDQQFSKLLGLSLGAIGIVYGDIGTSPLYALRECFHGPHAIVPNPENVLGVLSLVFWSLTIVISWKYLVLIMRADNDGEGGILALMALVCPNGANSTKNWLLIILGLFGAALLYGDGVITPAISVLSAVEGLEIAAPQLEHFVVPITLLILVGLFSFQRFGTEKIGFIFGPIMMLWFTTLIVLGVSQIAQRPDVLWAINPWHGMLFFVNNGIKGFLILGVVFLVVTGGEALYADMGHFGKRPIRWAWFSVVFPALLINYMGQGALLLSAPDAESLAKLASNPFYYMSPSWGLYPLVVLSTVATIIASQAIISGAFSLTMQAVQLGYMPRVDVRHTSDTEYGQIYIPLVNWLLLLATLALVVGFGSSSKLAAAYGIAVTATMVITNILVFYAMDSLWKWPMWMRVTVTAALLGIDLSFFGANMVKVADGGWFPLLVGLFVLTIMSTWRRGREVLAVRFEERALTFEEFFKQIETTPPARVPGMEIHLYSNSRSVPRTLLVNVRHNHVMHEKIVIVTVIAEKVPYVAPKDRVKVETLREGFHRVLIRYGFDDTRDVPRELRHFCTDLASPAELKDATYLLGRETVLATDRPGMAMWRETLFGFLSRNAYRATAYYQIPTEQVLEIGDQIEM